MRCADENCLGRDPAFRVHRLAHRFDQRPADAQGVDAHQGHALLAVVEDRRPDLARIVQRAVECLAVSAGLLHADVGRDVAFGKADLEQRFRRSRPNGSDSLARKQHDTNCTSEEVEKGRFIAENPL